MRTLEMIEHLGSKIIRCQEKCEGVENNQKEGFYPRAFFLDPKNASQVEIAIVGKNPGNSSCLEREFYIALAERNENKEATFKDCQRVWRSIAEQHDYYQRPKHLLEELGLSLNAILWAEVAFCEKSLSARRIPKETFQKCSSRFLREIMKLVPRMKHVVCLGDLAFRYMRNLPESSKWKILCIYHPTGSHVFANYFKKERGKKVTERRLKRELLSKFNELEESESTYIWKLKP